MFEVSERFAKKMATVWATVSAPYSAGGDDQVSGQPGDRFQVLEGTFNIVNHLVTFMLRK